MAPPSPAKVPASPKTAANEEPPVQEQQLEEEATPMETGGDEEPADKAEAQDAKVCSRHGS